MALGASSCGGARNNDLLAGTVARVNGHVITLTELRHWIRVVGNTAYLSNTGVPSPSWAMPEPPAYKECVKHLKSTFAPGLPLTSAVNAHFKRLCEASLANLRQKALRYLIQAIWDEEQAMESGLVPSGAEVTHEYRHYVEREYPVPGALQKILDYSGMTVTDLRFRVRDFMLSRRLWARLENAMSRVQGHGAAELAKQNELTVGARNKLVNATSCRAGYVIEVCREYKGSQQL
jgi:hypothetical protein